MIGQQPQVQTKLSIINKEGQQPQVQSKLSIINKEGKLKIEPKGIITTQEKRL
jgi:hypothetical protein